MATTNPMVQFKFGKWDGFSKLKSWTAGALYITTDEQGIYFSKDGDKPVKLGNIITYNDLKEFTDKTLPPYNSEVFYYITDSNALIKYNGSKFVQLNKDYGDDVAGLLAVVGEDTDEESADTLWGKIKKAQSTADTASTTASTANSAASTAQGTADSALAKANANAGDITTINGKISTLEGIVINGDNSNSKLREAITTNATATSTAQSKANDAYALAQTADGKADTNATAIEAINGNIETITNDIAILDGAIDEISESLGLGDVTGDESLSGRLKNVEDKADTNAAAISTIQTNYATKAYAGSEADAAEAAAKSYADTEIGSAKTALIGEETTGNTSTIKGVKKYTDEQIATVNSSISTLQNNIGKLENDIGSLENVMNFRGVFNTFTDVINPQNGDVIVINGIEWVYVSENHDYDKNDEENTLGWEPIGAATENESRFQALEGRVKALDEAGTGKVAILESGLSTANSNIAANTSAINIEKGRVDTLINTFNTTISGINNDIEAIEQAITDEESRAKGVEEGLRTDVDTIETAHNTLAERVTALDKANTGRVAAVESNVNTLNNKTGIDQLTGDNTTLYSLITAEATRADAEEKDIRADFAEADAALRSEFNAALTWSTWDED